MNWYLTALGAVAAAGLGFGLYRAARSPRFVAGLAAIVSGAIWKALLPSLKGRLMTPEEKAKWDAGENPHDRRQIGKDSGR